MKKLFKNSKRMSILPLTPYLITLSLRSLSTFKRYLIIINDSSLQFEKDGANQEVEVKSLHKTSESVIDDAHDEDHEIRKRIQDIMAEYAQSNATAQRGISLHKYESDPKYWKQE